MIKHRHVGKYRTRRGVVKRKPIHPVIRAKRPLKMPANWVPSKRYRGWAEIPVKVDEKVIPVRRFVVERKKIPLGIIGSVSYDREYPQPIIVRDVYGKIKVI